MTPLKSGRIIIRRYGNYINTIPAFSLRSWILRNVRPFTTALEINPEYTDDRLMDIALARNYTFENEILN